MEAWRKRSLWNPMVLPHACGPKESCLKESRCHQEHLENSLRCLYSISLLHVSTAGSCVILSSHVLFWRGPFAKQKANAEHLILTGMLHPTRHAGWSESTGWKRLSCRVRLKRSGESLWWEDMTTETGCIWDANGPERSKVSQGLADITQLCLWSFGTALQREKQT